MTAADLIEMLTDAAAELGVALEDLPVLIADQPNWPLAKMIAAVTPDAGDIEQDDGGLDPGAPCIWIASGDHPSGRSPYAPAGAWGGVPDGIWAAS